MNKLQLFMYLYMYELELWLNEHTQEVSAISFQSDEANTDRPLKEYLRDVILSKCSRITKLKSIINIEIVDSNKIVHHFFIDDKVKSAYIEFVYLPEEITSEIKDILKRRKSAVFTNPDLCIVINIDGKLEYETIELKSTKSDSIPGSSVQQIAPNEWVIFVKHGKSEVEVATGQYYHAINSKMQFPDRSPRPQVSFSELQNWNSLYRKKNETAIAFYSIGDESVKCELLTDWQGVLAKRWSDIVFDKKVKKKEPWFNNNLRKFIIEFLNKYDSMNLKEQAEYKKHLKEITK